MEGWTSAGYFGYAPGMPRYAVDIETDTTPCHQPPQRCCETRGLDPSRTRITEIAVVGGKLFSEVLVAEPPTRRQTAGEGTAAEAKMLAQFTNLLGALETGVVVTWNGAAFDAPFLAERYQANRMSSPIRLAYDPSILLKYAALPGHPGAYRAAFGSHRHIDIAPIFQPVAEALGVRYSLKPMTRAMLGADPIEVTRTRMHDLSSQARRDYVASDAGITLALSQRIDPDRFTMLIDSVEPVRSPSDVE